jgi:hypothetical protein
MFDVPSLWQQRTDHEFITRGTEATGTPAMQATTAFYEMAQKG